MEAAFNEFFSDFGEVLREPTFSRPGCADIKGNDSVRGLEVLSPKDRDIALHVVGDKDFKPEDVEVIKAGVVKNFEVRVDLVH